MLLHKTNIVNFLISSLSQAESSSFKIERIISDLLEFQTILVVYHIDLRHGLNVQVRDR